MPKIQFLRTNCLFTFSIFFCNRADLVVVTQLGNMNCIFRYFINESVFIIDSPRPIAGKSVFKRFRFSNAFKRVTLCFFDKDIDTAKHLFIGFLTKEIIFPGVIRKGQLHSKSSLSVPLSFSSCTIDSIKRLVFLGGRSR